MEKSESPIKILIADDHPLMRQGVRMALEAEGNMTVIGEASDGEEALQCLRFCQPDVLILDLDMPKRDGLSVARELHRLKSDVGVIILTLHTGSDLLFEALDAGARGYILKGSAVSDVVEAVRRVNEGGSYLSEAVQQALEKGKKAAGLSSALKQLTPLEREVLRRVAEGLTSRELAASLQVSARTVENYRTAICSKLDLKGPNALLRFALRQREMLTF